MPLKFSQLRNVQQSRRLTTEAFGRNMQAIINQISCRYFGYLLMGNCNLRKINLNLIKKPFRNAETAILFFKNSISFLRLPVAFYVLQVLQVDNQWLIHLHSFALDRTCARPFSFFVTLAFQRRLCKRNLIV